MDYKIEILEDERKLKVTTKFDVYYLKINKIEGVEECNHLTRYKFTVKIGEMFTIEEGIKNIQSHLAAWDSDPYLIDASKVKTAEEETEDYLDRLAATFKGELYGKEEKKNWWTFIKNLWKGENGKKVSVKWPL